MKKLLFVLLVAWTSSFAYFRNANTEVWVKDKQSYVIYPATPVGQGLYYLWRPLSYVDKELTGRGSHIGPHR